MYVLMLKSGFHGVRYDRCPQTYGAAIDAARRARVYTDDTVLLCYADPYGKVCDRIIYRCQ